VYLGEILYSVDDIEGDLYHSRMSDILTSEVGQLLKRVVYLNGILYGFDDVEDDLDAVLLIL
jgi:hypothetical protein